MKVTRILLILLAVFFLASLPLGRNTRSSPLQTGQPTAPAAAQVPTPQPDPPGTIDGRKNPELIPDNVAYQLLFLAVAEPWGATDNQKARARNKLAQAILTDGDTDGLLWILSDFKRDMDNIDDQARAIYARSPIPVPGTSDYQALMGLQKSRDQFLANAIAALPARLTPAGVNNLYVFLQKQKHGMKIVPEMPM